MHKKKLYFSILISTLALLAIGVLLFMLLKYIPEQKEQALIKEQVRQYYEAKYQLYRQENEDYDDYEVEVAFLGDSLTDGYDLKKYYPNLITANRGIGGETTIGLEQRLTLSVYDLKPKVVVMLIGGNNLNTMFENYEDILVGLQQNLPQTKVVILSLTAMGRDWAYKNHLAAYNNVKIKALSEKYNFTYIDLFTLLLDPETDEIRAEYTNDGVHLTDEGYIVLTNAITPVLNALLSKT
jgi:lysophospholipase L1-like esterase